MHRQTRAPRDLAASPRQRPGWRTGLLQDFRYGLRSLRMTPGFTLIAVLTLALGIGASTVMFSVFSGVLLAPLPFEQPERLVKIWNQRPSAGAPRDNFSVGEFHEIATRTRTLESVAAYYPDWTANLSGGSQPIAVTFAYVTADFLPALGVAPFLGRNFLPEEDIPGGDDAVILSHGLWQRGFGADEGLIGRSILVDGLSKRVVGVMPQGFDYPSSGTDGWLPMGLDRININYNTGQSLRIIARLGPGISTQQMEEDLASVAEQITAENLTRYPGMETFPVTLQDEIVGVSKTPLRLLMVVVAAVLLIACANVAGLLLARSTTMERKFALQMALGASRSRVIRQMLIENLLLSLAAGGAGLLLTYLGIRVLLTLGSGSLPRMNEIRIDGTVLAFTFFVTLLATILTVIVPALRSSGLVLSETLKEGGRTLGGHAHLRTQNLLVVSEVALSFMLLIGAGLLGKTLLAVLSVDPGFQTENVLTLRTALPTAKYQDSQVSDFFEQLIVSIKNLPGVEEAGAGSVLPLSGARTNGYAWIEGVEPSPDILPPRFDTWWVVPGYFKTLNIPLLDGRLLETQDDPTDPLVTVVSRSLAETLWPGESALGKRFKLSRQPTDSTPWRTVVGVVGDIHHDSLDARVSHTAYFPHRQQPSGKNNMFLVVRSSVNPAALGPLIKSTIQKIDPDQPVYAERTMEDLLSYSVSRQRFSAILLALFAALALTMAAVGLYGVVSYGVSQRTREIGIRIALAASPRAVLKMILKEGMNLALVGMAVGLVGALLLTRYMETLLFNVTPLDPITFAGVALALVGIALLACFVPARRATKVDPMVALHYE